MDHRLDLAALRAECLARWGDQLLVGNLPAARRVFGAVMIIFTRTPSPPEETPQDPHAASDQRAIMNRYVGVDDVVRSGLEAAARRAAVAADRVAVIALLGARRPLRCEHGIEQAIAALRERAIDVARRGRPAGVALLAGVEDGVAAELDGATAR